MTNKHAKRITLGVKRQLNHLVFTVNTSNRVGKNLINELRAEHRNIPDMPSFRMPKADLAKWFTLNKHQIYSVAQRKGEALRVCRNELRAILRTHYPAMSPIDWLDYNLNLPYSDREIISRDSRIYKALSSCTGISPKTLAFARQRLFWRIKDVDPMIELVKRIKYGSIESFVEIALDRPDVVRQYAKREPINL